MQNNQYSRFDKGRDAVVSLPLYPYSIKALIPFMRAVKITLILVFFVHLISVARFNLVAMDQLKKKDRSINRLNSFGEAMVYHGHFDYLTLPVFSIFNGYNVYTGTNRGYSFFSPNVTPVKVRISFSSNGKDIPIPLKTKESQSKLLVATYYLLNTQDTITTGILKAMSSRIFSLNPEVNQLEVYLELEKYQLLAQATPDNYSETGKFKAFTITRD
jgi:hypothetical protein